MKYCENCRAELPEKARFCGKCGAVNDIPPDGQTRINDEDEERRRRAALLGMGLVELGAVPQVGSVPFVQGTPQVGSVPYVQGTPPAPGNALQAGSLQVTPHAPPAHLPSPVTPTPHLPSASSPTLTLHTHHPPSGSSSGSSGSSPNHGCAPTLIIAAITIPLVIIASIIGLGLTLLAPSLSLSGSNSITSGGTLHLHGSHFLPEGSIELTLDAATPIFVVRPQFTPVMAFTVHANQSAHSLAQLYMPAVGNNTINARSDGTFDVTITIMPSWSSGRHAIDASEALTHRSASLSFTILGPLTTPSPATTGSVTPTPTKTATSATPTPGPSSTAPSSQPGLSCINPASLSLGPVSENYLPAMTSTVTLCASGSGVIHWQASLGASWLSLSATSGQFNAPGEVQLTLSASAAQLGPGNYATSISFSSPSSSTTQALRVSFTVQAGCIKASPGSLTFMGVANVSDPVSQSVVLTNCGATGTWTASVKTSDGSNWLYVTPTSATLSGGAMSPRVNISTSNLKVQLVPNTYTGSVTFAIGSGSFTVQVTLIVQAPPNLSANTNSLTGSTDCSSSNSTFLCYVTLTNDSSSSSLTWTYSQNLVPSLVVKPSSFTLAPGRFERVPLYISQNDCSSGAQIVFTGPNNSVTVYWYCYPPIG